MRENEGYLKNQSALKYFTKLDKILNKTLHLLDKNYTSTLHLLDTPFTMRLNALLTPLNHSFKKSYNHTDNIIFSPL